VTVVYNRQVEAEHHQQANPRPKAKLVSTKKAEVTSVHLPSVMVAAARQTGRFALPLVGRTRRASAVAHSTIKVDPQRRKEMCAGESVSDKRAPTQEVQFDHERTVLLRVKPKGSSAKLHYTPEVAQLERQFATCAGQPSWCANTLL
jgi:hypothetical protein